MRSRTLKTFYIIAASVCIFSVPFYGGFAQEDTSSSDLSGQQEPEPVLSNSVQNEGEIIPSKLPSILFTFYEYAAIQDAKNSRGVARVPDSAELYDAAKEGAEPMPKPPPEERNIKLGGILYTTGNDWVIWLNGQRVTPQALPKEILDLKVYGKYIELKWFDEYTKQIFPIRLRPHQRFNIDTRIFLPG